MTIANVYLTPRAGYLVSDTAQYTPDGTLLTYAAKTLTIPHLRCAITTRGSSAFLMSALGHISFEVIPERCIDGLVPRCEPGEPAHGSRLQRVLTRAMEAAADSFSGDVIQAAQVQIMGWSDTENRVVAYLSVYDAELGTDFTPHRYGDGHYSMSPRLDVPDAKAFNRDIRKVEVPGTFIDMAKRQRAYAATLPGHVVGGSVIMTTITRNTIEQRSILEWPNELPAAETSHHLECAA